MKRRTTARTPPKPAPTPDSTTSDGQASEAKAAEKRWEIDQAGGIPAPVIRANMISLRVSYQGRVQVAFFDQH
jgi:hypothetical protein